MAQNLFKIILETLAVVSVLLFLPVVVRSHDNELIPSDSSQLNAWFDRQVDPRRSFIASALAAAELKSTTITVSAAGGANFKTISEAVNSIPANNKNRVVIHIGPGKYTEKITIDKSKPFVTLLGDPKDQPIIVFDGTAEKYGTVDSATLVVNSDYFSAVNLKIVNSSPMPDGVRKLAMAVALRVSGDYSSIYNCSIYGFQDTLCDDKGRHVFKDCYIEGTVDFIFGSGQSLYLNSEIHVVSGGSNHSPRVITAQARKTDKETNGYVFAHCKVTGRDVKAYLGRIWFGSARVVFAFSELSDVVLPEGWSDNNKPNDQRSVYFGEYKNSGPGADAYGKNRVRFAKKLSDADAHQFLSLAFVEAFKWLLPPARV